jgi:hypothetical protein
MNAKPFAPVSMRALEEIDSEFFANRIGIVKLSLSLHINLDKSKAQHSTLLRPRLESFPRPPRFPVLQGSQLSQRS